MAFTFDDLQNEVSRRATKNESSSEFTTAIKNVINTSLFRLCREAYWRQLRRTTTLSVTVDTEEFNLPAQVTHRMFMWHEDYGYPYVMQYVLDQDFYNSGIDRTESGTPTHYRMWGQNMVLTQPTSASVVTIASSSSSDTSISVTVFGTVSGYPDYETIITNSSNGTTAVAGTKSFSAVERIVKAASSVGRITATSNSAAVTLAVLPVGDTTAGIMYSKIQLYPRASEAFTMNIKYYKEPYRLVNGGDVHELGQDFDEAIILLATSKINFENNKDEGVKFFNLYEDEIRSLKKTNVDKIDWFPTMRRSSQTRTDPLLHPFLSYRQAGGSFGPRVY